MRIFVSPYESLIIQETVSISVCAAKIFVGQFQSGLTSNNDGNQDLVTPDLYTDRVSIRLGDGLGGFVERPDIVLSSAAGPSSVAVGDFNRDGNQDIVVANWRAQTVSIYLGNGLGYFHLGSDTSTPGHGPWSIVTGDFNNDGKLDIATESFICLGDGFGHLPERLNVSMGGDALSVAIGDFNNDGNQDIAAANFGVSEQVTARLGNGLGGFGELIYVNSGNDFTRVVVGDFNRDGKQDLAFSSDSGGYIGIRLGNGLGGFIGTTNVQVGIARCVAIGDFNNDGNQDLTALSLGDDLVVVRLGNGQGGFSGGTKLSAPAPSAEAIGDFNNDGKQDIAVANRETNTVTIYLGRCTPE